jgi:hypothetical protein
VLHVDSWAERRSTDANNRPASLRLDGDLTFESHVAMLESGDAFSSTDGGDEVRTAF